MRKFISLFVVLAMLLSMSVTAAADTKQTSYTSQSKLLVPLHGEKAEYNANQTLTAVGATEITVVDTESLSNPTSANVPKGSAYYIKALNTTAKNGAVFETPDIDFRDIYTGDNGKTNEANWYFEGWLWVSDVTKIGNFVMRIYPKGCSHSVLNGATVDYWLYQTSLQNIDIDGTIDGTQKLVSGWNHLKIKMSTLSNIISNYNANNDTANQGYIASAIRDFLDKYQVVSGFSIHDHTASKANNYTWALAGARIVEADGIDSAWGTEEIAGIYADTFDTQTTFLPNEAFNTDNLKDYKLLASGDSEEILNYTVSRSGKVDDIGREKVNISYTENGITYNTYYYLKSVINPLTDNMTGWTPGNTAVQLSMDTSDKVTGNASLAVTNTASGMGMIIFEGDMGHELYARPGDNITFWAKVSDVSKIGTFTFEVASTHTFFPATRYTISGTNLSVAFSSGEWKKISFTVPAFDSIRQNDANGYYNVTLGADVYTGANYENIKYFRIFWNVASTATTEAPLTVKFNSLTVERQQPKVYTNDFTAFNGISLDEGWSVTAANGYGFDSSVKTNGDASIKINGDADAFSLLIWKGNGVKGERIDLTDIATIEYDIYLPLATDLKELYLEIASSPNWYNNITRFALVNSSTNNGLNTLKQGWNTIRIAVPKGSLTTQAVIDGHGKFTMIPSSLRPADISRICFMRLYFKATDNVPIRINNLRLVKNESVFSNAFGDNAVLQQNKPISLYGKVGANEQVSINIAKGSDTVISGTVTADNTGYWHFVSKDTVKGSFDEYTVTASTANRSTTLKNIMFGEVWAAGGQSNMEFNISKSAEPEVYTNMGRNKYIRFYAQSGAIGHEDTLNTDGGEWLVDNNDNYMYFSSVAYSFAVKLSNELNIPVGIIESAVGGSSSLTWLDPEDLKKNYTDIYKYVLQNGWVEGIKYVNRADKNDLLSWYTPNNSNDVLGGYYYSRITPFKNYNANGIIWYQGCHDVNREPLQAYYMDALQTQWSRVFSTDDAMLPLIYFELAPYTTIDNTSNGNMRHYAQMRKLNAERGYDSIFAVPNYDLWTDISDIHPNKKHTLALRGADIALEKVYSTQQNTTGPVVVDAVSDGKKVTVTFENVGDGLELSKGSQLSGFGYLVGTVYTELPAVISSPSTVEVDISGINTDRVFYACGNQMLSANLMNSYGYMSNAFFADVVGDADVFEAESTDEFSFSGEWQIKNHKSFSSSGAMFTNNGGVAEITFEGDLFEIVSYKSYTQGSLLVSIDGGEETEVSLYSNTVDTDISVKVFSKKVASGTHTVRITAQNKAYIDAINIRGNVIANNTHNEGYCEVQAENCEKLTLDGKWTSVHAWKLSDHNAIRTKSGASASFTYTGYGFKLIGYKSASQGKMYVSIDSKSPVLVDLYDQTTDECFNAEVFSSGILDNSTHTVTITTEGTVVLDAIMIDGQLN